MHAELLSSVAAERRRDLFAGPGRYRARRVPGASRPLPGLRISWSRATLAGATSRGRSRSWVIVISATRTL
jgi:hypothetical protein